MNADTAIAKEDNLLFDGHVFNADGTDVHVESRMKVLGDDSNEQLQFATSAEYKENIHCSYFTPSFSLATIIPNVVNVFSNKQEKIVIEALKKIDSRIVDFVLVDSTVMVDVGLEKRLPINLLGDGVRKFFTLVVAMSGCKDGILLVDEIDNGLHFSSMEKFWQVLFDAAHLFNVQLFASTHNIDSLKGLNRILNQHIVFQNDVTAFKILRRDDNTSFTLRYDYKSFSKLIESETEIR